MSTLPKLFVALCSLVLMFSVSTAAHAEDDVAVLRAAVSAQRARVPAPRFERSRFLVRSTIRNATLSPDGLHVAYLREQGRNRSVWLMATAGGAPRRLLQQSEVTALFWSRDSRWLLLESSRQLFALAAAGQTGSGIVSTLAGREKRELQMLDPSQSAAVLVVEQTRASPHKTKRWRLLRVDMSGKRSLLHEDAQQIVDFAFDPNGRLAFLERVEGEDLVIHRIDASKKLHEVARCVKLQRCALLPIANDAGELLLRADLGGNLSRLLRLDKAGRMYTLHEDPRNTADLDALVLDPITQQPLIASYRSTTAANYGLDPETKRHVDRIDRQLPQRNLRISIGRGNNANWLVQERGSALQGERWHLYNPRTGKFNKILDAQALAQRSEKPIPWLSESSLARQIPFAYRAADGMRLHGFLLLPPGRDPKQLPLVANVHGGPWNRARPDFDPVSQFLVNRGYVVFEPNFRGSTGHGRDYTLAAQGDFGNGRVQQDIVDGVRYLLAQGIGDAQRIGITGASFGGYSTLLGLTFQPELFKVGVAIVPPPDLGWDMRMVERSSEALNLSRFIPFKHWLRMLSLDLDDGASMQRLHDQSPLANADKMQAPLLLVAGGEDRRVPVRGVIHYAAQLKLHGKDVSLLLDTDAGHASHGPLSREADLYLLEWMLSRHLGGAVPSAPDRELRDYLQRNLKIAGKDLQSLTKPVRQMK